MTTAQWIVYYTAELMNLMPALSAEEAARLATHASANGMSEQPEIAAQASIKTV